MPFGQAEFDHRNAASATLPARLAGFARSMAVRGVPRLPSLLFDSTRLPTMTCWAVTGPATPRESATRRNPIVRRMPHLRIQRAKSVYRGRTGRRRRRRSLRNPPGELQARIVRLVVHGRPVHDRGAGDDLDGDRVVGGEKGAVQ